MVLPRFDPLPAYNFQIALMDTSSTTATLKSMAGLVMGGFTECTGLESTLDVHEYLEGGVNDRVHRFPSRISVSNIVLKRGIGLGEGLWLWHQEFMKGEGKRRNGLIFLFGEMGAAVPVPIKTWVFENGLPVKWTGPAFNASTSEVSIEALEIAHEKLTLISPGTLAADALGAIF